MYTLSPTVKMSPATPSSRGDVMSPVLVEVSGQYATSPPPTMTGSPEIAVVNAHVGPVVVLVPSNTLTYHSKRWLAPRPDQIVLVVVPDGTPLFVAMTLNTPLS